MFGTSRTPTIHSSFSRLLLLAALVTLPLTMLGTLAPADAARRAAAPKQLRTASTQPTSVTVTWRPKAGAARYKVRWSAKRSMKQGRSTVTSGTRTTLTSLRPATTYFVQVAAVSTTGRQVTKWSPRRKVRTPKTKTSQAAKPGKCTIPPADNPTTPATVTGEPYDLHVADFNVLTAGRDLGTNKPTTWTNRRNLVTRLLTGTGTLRNAAEVAPDVISVQEASDTFAYFTQACLTQYLDLRNLLSSQGKGRYELTETAREASSSNRILFNTDRLRMLEHGSVRLHPSTKLFPFMPWAIFEVREGGQQFVFASVHLQPYGQASIAVRIAEWNKVIETLTDTRITKGLPVIVGGDFNANRMGGQDGKNSTARTQLPKMYKSGIGDTLVRGGRLDNVMLDDTRAEVAINHRCTTLSRLQRNQSCSQPGVLGQHIDYIFASNALRVKKWEMVLNTDREDNWVGTIPSDHNMIRATIELPAVQ